MTDKKEIQSLEKKCKETMHIPGIRFVGVINQMGNLIAGGVKHGVKPHANEKQRRILYMQLLLEFKMRSELNEVLGPISNITVTRGKVKKITIPLEKKIIVISTEKNIDADQVLKKASEIFL